MAREPESRSKTVWQNVRSYTVVCYPNIVKCEVKQQRIKQTNINDRNDLFNQLYYKEFRKYKDQGWNTKYVAKYSHLTGS